MIKSKLINKITNNSKIYLCMTSDTTTFCSLFDEQKNTVDYLFDIKIMILLYGMAMEMKIKIYYIQCLMRD